MIGRKLFQKAEDPNKDKFKIDVSLGDIITFLREVNGSKPSEAAGKLYFGINTNISMDMDALDVYKKQNKNSVIHYIDKCIIDTCYLISNLYRTVLEDQESAMPMISANTNNIIGDLSKQRTDIDLQNNISAAVQQINCDIMIGTELDTLLSKEVSYNLLYIANNIFNDKLVGTIVNTLSCNEDYKEIIKKSDAINKLLNITELLALLLHKTNTVSFNSIARRYQPNASDELIKGRLPHDALLILSVRNIKLPDWLKAEQYQTGYNLHSNKFIAMYNKLLNLLSGYN